MFENFDLMRIRFDAEAILLQSYGQTRTSSDIKDYLCFKMRSIRKTFGFNLEIVNCSMTKSDKQISWEKLKSDLNQEADILSLVTALRSVCVTEAEEVNLYYLRHQPNFWHNLSVLSCRQ